MKHTIAFVSCIFLCGSIYGQDTLYSTNFFSHLNKYEGWVTYPPKRYRSNVTGDTIYYEHFLSSKTLIRNTYSQLTDGLWYAKYNNGVIKEIGKFEKIITSVTDHTKKNASRTKCGKWLYFTQDGKFDKIIDYGCNKREVILNPAFFYGY